jgi:serine phosphatase RsbU (regulator of sigma subunit)
MFHPRLSFRTKLALALFGLAAGTAAVALELAWHRGRAAQLDSLRSLLVTTTAAVAPEIDGDAHAALAPSPALAGTPEYAALRSLAKRLTDANPRFKEVFTVSLVDPPEEGWGRLVLTDVDADIGKPYEFARFPAMAKAAAGTALVADDDLLEDEYGVTISGYAAIRDRSRRPVAVLGIDVDASTVRGMRRDLLLLVLWSGLAAVVLGGLAAWFLSRRIARPVAALTAGMDRVAAGDFDARLTGRTGDEFERLFAQFNRMTAGLEERQRLKQSIAIAMEIQQHLLPAKPPEVAGVDLAAVLDYCDETGGDYYDFPAWPLPGGRVAITVGDVTGHGIGAALLMASGRAVLRTHAERGESPGALLALVNEALAKDAAYGKFMTLFYGVLDPAAGTLVYANAGQGGCSVRRASDGRVETLPAGGPPLGVFGGLAFPEGRIEGLAKGDLVVLATDGIWETVDLSGAHFGFERLDATVAAAAAGDAVPAARVAEAVIAAAATHRGSGPQTDDITLVVARMVPRSRVAS